MVHIVTQIKEALGRKDQFIIDRKGVLRVEGSFVRFIRKLFGWENGWIMNVSSHCNKILENMEKGASSAEIKIESFESLKVKLKELKSKKGNLIIADLSLRVEALRARIGEKQETFTKKEKLIELAQNWKNNYKLYEHKDLIDAEKIKLDELANYSGYAELLIQGDIKMQDECFKWVLRDNNSVEAYVKFPTICKKLKTSLLAGRAGRFAATSLKVENNDLTLPFEVMEDGQIKSKRISILDEKKVVHFPGNYSLTMDKIFKVFKDKNDKVGNLEYFGENGISNFHAHELGRWNQNEKCYEKLDFSSPNWWLNLPVYETISKSEVQKRFKLKELDDKEWLAVARSSTESLELDIDKSHGYLGIIIPLEDGKWRVYDFGKFAKKFPSTLIQKIFMIGDTVQGKIAYIDENDFYSQRIQAKAPIKITADQGKLLMDAVKEDILKARGGNIVFQIGWENCAYWPQDKLNKLLGDACPNFYRMKAAQATASTQPLQALFEGIKKTSENTQKIFFRSLEWILIGRRGVKVVENGKKVYKCIVNSEFHKTQEIFVPGYNHKQIRDPNNKYHGVITFGHLNIQHKVN